MNGPLSFLSQDLRLFTWSKINYVLKDSQGQIEEKKDNNVDLDIDLTKEEVIKKVQEQIFGCWSIPLGLPYNENLLVRIKLKLNPDGSVVQSEILDHARMNKPGQGFYKVLAESALRAIKLCQPLRVPVSYTHLTLPTKA